MKEIVMPKLGVMMEEGTVLRWIKAEGDEVNEGEAVSEIESDKARPSRSEIPTVAAVYGPPTLSRFGILGGHRPPLQ